MINKLKQLLQNVDKKIFKIMKNGIYFCLLIFIFSSIILFTYDVFYASPTLFYLGLSIFQLGIICIISFIICGFAIDTIKKQLT